MKFAVCVLGSCIRSHCEIFSHEKSENFVQSDAVPFDWLFGASHFYCRGIFSRNKQIRYWWSLRIEWILLGPIRPSVIDDDAEVFRLCLLRLRARQRIRWRVAIALASISQRNFLSIFTRWLRLSAEARINVCIIHGSKKHKTGWASAPIARGHET